MAIRRNATAIALRGLDRQQAGMYVPGDVPWIQTASVALTASRMHVVRFIAASTMTISKISFLLTVAAGANDNCDVGVFSSDGVTLLGSAGSTAGKLNASPNTVQTCNMQSNFTVRQGKVYYGAFSSGTQGGTAASVAMTSMAAGSSLCAMFGSTVGIIEQSFQASVFPIAAPLTVGGGITNCPVLILQQ